MNEKLNLKMVLKGDDGPVMESDGMFSLKLIKSDADMQRVLDQQPDVLAEPEEEEDSDEPKRKYERYDKDSSHLDKSGLFYKDSDSELEMESDDDEDGDNVAEGLG